MSKKKLLFLFRPRYDGGMYQTEIHGIDKEGPTICILRLEMLGLLKERESN